MQRRLIALFGALTILALPVASFAKPLVSLKLAGFLVQKATDGKEQLTPVEKTVLKPGEIVRYEIDALNAGDSAASKLAPVAHIPANTTFVAGTASAAAAATIEYSLDGGKTWSLRPMVTVQTPTGPVQKPADPATYNAVKWISTGSLAPKSTVAYLYEVRVSK